MIRAVSPAVSAIAYPRNCALGVAQEPHWEGARGLGCSSWRRRTAGRSTDQVGLTPFDRVSR
jgi:hypothetical protein